MYSGAVMSIKKKKQGEGHVSIQPPQIYTRAQHENPHLSFLSETN